MGSPFFVPPAWVVQNIIICRTPMIKVNSPSRPTTWLLPFIMKLWSKKNFWLYDCKESTECRGWINFVVKVLYVQTVDRLWTDIPISVGYGVMANIIASHAIARGSIPRIRVFLTLKFLPRPDLNLWCAYRCCGEGSYIYNSSCWSRAGERV